MIYLKKHYLQTFFFIGFSILTQVCNGQTCTEVTDSLWMVKIEGLMKNGRPFSNLFILKNSEYETLLDTIESFKELSDLINFCGSNGTVTFPFSERSFFAMRKCYSFNSVNDKNNFINRNIDSFFHFEKSLEKNKQLFFSDKSQALMYSKHAYFILWKLPSHENMLRYSSATFFSDNLKYDKAYYFEIKCFSQTP